MISQATLPSGYEQHPGPPIINSYNRAIDIAVTDDLFLKPLFSIYKTQRFVCKIWYDKRSHFWHAEVWIEQQHHQSHSSQTLPALAFEIDEKYTL